MPCTPFELPGGARGIVCTRGRRTPRRPCQWCSATATLLCDTPKGRGTCDAAMCRRHATASTHGDACPACARQTELFG